MAFYQDPFSIVHIHTLAVIHINDLKSAQTFHLYNLILSKSLLNQIKEIIDEC